MTCSRVCVFLSFVFVIFLRAHQSVLIVYHYKFFVVFEMFSTETIYARE